MRYLLDTQIVIWAMIGSERLPDRARAILEDPGNWFCVSSASVWETAIKHALKPDAMPVTAEQMIRFCRESGIAELPVRFAHASRVDALPRIHSDPFDRILIAQTQEAGVRLLSHDGKLPAYGGCVDYV